MLLPLNGRNIAYDLPVRKTAPVVCMTHSLASDGGMWTEQLPPLLQAGFRVLRIDMRGHGGSDPVAGDYTRASSPPTSPPCSMRSPSRACISSASPSAACSARPSHSSTAASSHPRCGATRCPARRPARLKSGSSAIDTVRNANSLTPLADPTIERWLTDAVKTAAPRPLEADPRHHHRHHARRLSRLRRRDPQLRLRRRACRR